MVKHSLPKANLWYLRLPLDTSYRDFLVLYARELLNIRFLHAADYQSNGVSPEVLFLRGKPIIPDVDVVVYEDRCFT